MVSEATKPKPDVRTTVRELVDDLPEGELKAAQRYLEYLRDQGDPMIRLLDNAPYDDEPTTPEDDADAREGWEEYKRGECESLDDVKRERLE